MSLLDTPYRIDQGHSQAVAGRTKRRAQRELYSSSRQSRFTDIHTRDQHEIARYFHVVEGIIAPVVDISYARRVQRGTTVTSLGVGASRAAQRPACAPLVLTIRSYRRALQRCNPLQHHTRRQDPPHLFRVSVNFPRNENKKIQSITTQITEVLVFPSIARHKIAPRPPVVES